MSEFRRTRPPATEWEPAAFVFLIPSPAWVDWLAGYAGGWPVVDVGCGPNALLVRALRKRGVKAVGIDPMFDYDANKDDPSLAIAQLAEECGLLREPQTLVLFCRPSHGGWVLPAVRRVPEESDVLYISKPSNLETDLPGVKTEIVTCPTMNCEKVYRVLRQPATS